MKKATSEKQEHHDKIKKELYSDLKEIENSLYKETKDWSLVFSNDAYKNVFKRWAAHRNKCPECGSKSVSVKDYNPMWQDGNLVCDICQTFVRYWDAG